MSRKQIVILGAGTGGTTMANRLKNELGDEVERGRVGITVVDPEPVHLYQPGLLFVPFGGLQAADVQKPRRRFLPRDTDWIRAPVEGVDPKRMEVTTGGRVVPYDALIVATGAQLRPEETDGLLGEHYHRTVFDFYTLEGALALRKALLRFKEGRIVVAILGLPIKCPVAPLEFSFLADAFFRERGLREDIQITYVTPQESVFSKPTAAHHLDGLMDAKDIEVIADFSTGRVDGAARQLVSWDDRTVDYDLLVVVPLHGGAPFIGEAGLGDELDFVRTHPHTLQSRAYESIVALGDVTDLPTSKAGSVSPSD